MDENELDETAFWCKDHENDLMHSLAKRWTELSSSKREQLEDRLLQGDSRYDSRDMVDVDADSVCRYKANSSLSRLFWLKEQECSLSEGCLQQCEELKAIIPDHKLENIKLSAGSGVQVYTISSDYKYDDLLSLKISELIPEATKQSGRSHDHTKDNKPFAGLATKHGWLAFFALYLSAKDGKYPESSWCEFLSHYVRENAEEQPLGQIADLISDCPLDISEELIYTISDWFNDKGRALKASYPRAFQRLLNKVIKIFHHNARILNIRYLERTATEWCNASLNSPIGKITELLIQELDTDEVKLTNQFPEWWLQAVESLLSLKYSLPALSFAMLTQCLSWFYSISPSWTKAHLLSALTEKSIDSRNAFWCGFLTRAQISYELMPELQSALYELAVDSEFKASGFERNICALILLDWEDGQQKKCASDSNRELRELLLLAGEHHAIVFLRTIESWCNDDDRKSVWLPLSITFLNEVWPRQKSMRTPKISAQLFKLIFSNKTLFDNLHRIIIPKLSAVERGNGLYISRREPEKEIIRNRPFNALQAFHRILPPDAHSWPYNIDSIIQDLLDADEGIKHKPEMIELKRRWDSL